MPADPDPLPPPATPARAALSEVETALALLRVIREQARQGVPLVQFNTHDLSWRPMGKRRVLELAENRATLSASAAIE